MICHSWAGIQLACPIPAARIKFTAVPAFWLFPLSRLPPSRDLAGRVPRRRFSCGCLVVRSGD